MITFNSSSRSMSSRKMESELVNSGILRDIESKIKSSKLIPTAGFDHRTQIIEEAMHRNCLKMAQDIRLIDELFLPREITATAKYLHNNEGQRLPRALFTTIVTGIAVLSRVFSATQIFQLSSETKALADNQSHLISTVKKLAQRQEAIVEVVKGMKDQNQDFRGKMSAYAFESNIVEIMQVMGKKSRIP